VPAIFHATPVVDVDGLKVSPAGIVPFSSLADSVAPARSDVAEKIASNGSEYCAVSASAAAFTIDRPCGGVTVSRCVVSPANRPPTVTRMVRVRSAV